MRENVLLGMRLVEVKTLQRVQETFPHHEGKKLSDIQVGFRKVRGTKDQIVNIHCIIEKAREFQKKIYFLIDSIKDFTVWITTNYGKCFKRWKYQTSLLAPEKFAGQEATVRTGH